MALTQSQYDFVDRAAQLNDHAQVIAHEMCWCVIVEFKTQRPLGRWACEALYAIDEDANVIQRDRRSI